MCRQRSAVRTWASVLVAAGLAAAGCSTDPERNVGSEIETLESPPAQPDEARRNARIADAYHHFWQVSWVTGDLDAQWQHELARVTSDPLRSQLQRRARQQRSEELRLYGQVTPRITDVRVAGNTAIVRDCQDTSGSGKATLDGTRETRGVDHNVVTAHMVRRDNRWTVDRLGYPGGEC